MRIGIHTLWMDSDPNGGIASYLKTLITHLGQVDSRNTYTVYYSHSRALAGADYLPARFQTRVLWPASLWIEVPISLPLELLHRPVDLLHALIIAPPLCPVPFVQTLNDVVWETQPEVYPASVRLRLSMLVRSTARRARKIITVSEFSKKTIMECYGIPDEKIIVTYHGVQDVFRRVDDPAALTQVRATYHLPQRFILYVGKLQARKNLSRLLRAFSVLKRERHVAHKLVLVGKKTWKSAEIWTVLRELELEHDVIMTGEVPLDDLVLLYNAADLFVFPSLGEGFGIPPLEAMACDTPVVASNATSIPEVVGDAAVLVDPYSVREIAQAMYDVLTVAGLRHELVCRGRKRAHAFSSTEMAEKVLRVYEAAATG